MKQFEDLPATITHPAHPAHDLELTDGVPFVCDGCKEPGCGPRYTHDYGSHSFDLHTCCALAKGTLRHPLFCNGLTFEFLTEPLPPVDDTICDACGEAARGFVYHCRKKGGLDLHPCCASLPERILQDSRVFELRREASRSRPCGMCGEQSGRRRRFWAYRSNLDGEAMDIHVACMKDMARLSWESAYRKRVGGGGGQIVQVSVSDMDRMLQSFPGNRARRRSGFDKFVKIVGTVASIIIAVIFGNPVAMMAAIAGPGGLLRG